MPNKEERFQKTMPLLSRFFLKIQFIQKFHGSSLRTVTLIQSQQEQRFGLCIYEDFMLNVHCDVYIYQPSNQ